MIFLFLNRFEFPEQLPLDEFLQNEYLLVTSPQDEYVLIGKGENNFAAVHQRKGGVVWDTL